MRYRLALLVTILALVYFGGRYAYDGAFQAEDPKDTSWTENKDPTPLPEFVELAESHPFENEGTGTMPEFSPPDGLAKQGELLVSFADPQSYRDFLGSPEHNGIRIIDRNDLLNSIRLSVDNEEAASRIRYLAGSEASFGYNYVVAAPSSPQHSPSGRAGVPFENQALEWLGVPREHEDWGQGVKIAMLDTGLAEHFILGDKSIERKKLVESTENPDSEYNGHGTAIASILIGEDGLGIAPAADLISIQVMDSDGLGDSFTLAEGIIEAVDSGASVISMSLGSYGYTRVLDDAVSYALSKGVALVASAGNDGANVVPYPAQFQGVIGVGAIDADSQRAEFSNYSPSVDIAAPGVGVFAAWGDEEWISFSGTSAAAPYVSGSIAATLSLNPSLDPQEAADLLFQYADDGGAPGVDVETGNGTLNVDRVLSRDEPNIYDAAVCDFYLDYSQATASTIPLLVTVENRGTERLNSVSMEIVQNGGFPQKVYLGSLLENETTAHTIYLDRAQLAPEFGYTIQAETIISGREDFRSNNDAKSASLVIPKEEP